MADPTVQSTQIDSAKQQELKKFETVHELIQDDTSTIPGEHLHQLFTLIESNVESSFFNYLSPENAVEFTRCFYETIDYSANEPESKISILSPETVDFDWIKPQTIVIIQTPNMPFVIDSIQEYLSETNIRDNVRINGHITLETHATQNDTFTIDPESPTSVLMGIFINPTAEFNEHEFKTDIFELLKDIDVSTSDFQPLLKLTQQARKSLESYENEFDSDKTLPMSEYSKLLDYLINENFVFLGGFKRTLDTNESETTNALGVLREHPEQIENFITSIKSQTENNEMNGGLKVTKSSEKSHVYRRDRYDHIIVRSPDKRSDSWHEIHLIGLFTDRVLGEPAVDIPVLRKKFERILQREDIEEHTHRYRDVYTTFNTIPKHVLFMSTTDEIIEDIESIHGIRGDATFDLKIRPDQYDHGLSVMVLIEKNRFSGETRKSMQELLEEAFETEAVEYRLSIGESNVARLHFQLITDRTTPRHGDISDLEYSLYQLTLTWEDRLKKLIDTKFDGDKSDRIKTEYGSKFPDEYQTLMEPALAINDIVHLEKLRNAHHLSPLLDLINPENDNVTNLVLYHLDQLTLNETMPRLTNHGFQIIEQSTIEIEPNETTFYIHTFKIQNTDGNQIDLSTQKKLLLKSLVGGFHGLCRDDVLNKLVLWVNLTPRTLNLFRLYKNYYHQIHSNYKLESINRTFLQYPELVALLFDFFDAKFNPTRSSDRSSDVQTICHEIESHLTKIDERTPFQIFNSIFNLMQSTVRTNFYQPAEKSVPLQGQTGSEINDNRKPYISVKIDCENVTELPAPRPMYEIFVYSPFMEATHLRSGKIARGGIRWSDRRDDYRTEILELMKTQKVKNALIVPDGAKGGFVLKEEYLSDEKSLDEHAREQYSIFMKGILDITDNRKNGSIVSPKNTVRYDGDDPYMVVAADKGTAEFSDLANSISAKYDFWLKDAFASGGSVGYDHKELGITAKGAWECVKRHFRELDKDPSTDEISVVGIGDMSGDVFGNGMILSDRIKLVAAFNHRHIFLDPTPDPRKSYEERKRLFERDHSTWEDYDDSIISEGGGIFDRESNIIELSQHARDLLDLETDSPNPDDVIRSILTANVDLLWNGGIGTYIKASNETHTDVGDPANDPFRIDAPEVQANVIGEGGNLGITQKGRVELDQNGVKLNTDAIDNSGGVDLSDHEVNLKILIEESIKNDHMEAENRSDLLDSLTDPIVNEVIHDNYKQSGAISLESLNSHERIKDFRHLLNCLENSIGLDRVVEDLPSERELQDRMLSDDGMTRPELAILLSYSKLDMYQRALDVTWSDEWIIKPFITRYFPEEIVENHPESLERHPLRREIALTSLVNHAVNTAGFTFFYRLEEELGADLMTLMKAYLAADSLVSGSTIRNKIFEMDTHIDTDHQYEAWQTIKNLLGHAVTWLHDTFDEDYDYGELVESCKSKLHGEFDEILTHTHARQKEYIEDRQNAWKEKGFDQEFCDSLTRLSYLVPALDILMVKNEHDLDIENISEKYFKLGQHLYVDWIIRHIFENAGETRWDEFAFRSMGVELHQIQREILSRMIKNNITLNEFVQRNQETLSRLTDVKSKLDRENGGSFSAYQYMLQRIRSFL